MVNKLQMPILASMYNSCPSKAANVGREVGERTPACSVKSSPLFSFVQRQIRGDLISMFKIVHDLLEFPTESPTVTHLSFKLYICSGQHEFSVRTFPFWNKLPAASAVLSFKEFLFPETPIDPNSPLLCYMRQQAATHFKALLKKCHCTSWATCFRLCL